MPVRSLLLITLLILASDLRAEETVWIAGAGTHSCGKWLDAKNDKASRYQFQQWVFGFVSGMNWATKGRQATPVDNEAMTAFIDLYCTNNPLRTVLAASEALVEETGGPKASHEWKR